MGSIRGRQARERRSTTFLLVVVFFLFAGTFLFLRSPYFEISDFTVSGNVKVNLEDILALVTQESTNIFAYDLDKAQSLIASSPWVLEARVSRRLPSTISIFVIERTPIAFIPQDGTMWLVDSEGRILGEDDGTGKVQTAITGVLGKLTPGQFLDPESYGAALKIASLLPSFSRIRAIEVCVHEGACTLILDDGCSVLMGRDDNEVYDRLVLLDSILQDLSSAGSVARRIDLRFDKPAVTFYEGGR